MRRLLLLLLGVGFLLPLLPSTAGAQYASRSTPWTCYKDGKQDETAEKNLQNAIEDFDKVEQERQNQDKDYQKKDGWATVPYQAPYANSCFQVVCYDKNGKIDTSASQGIKNQIISILPYDPVHNQCMALYDLMEQVNQCVKNGSDTAQKRINEIGNEKRELQKEYNQNPDMENYRQHQKTAKLINSTAGKVTLGLVCVPEYAMDIQFDSDCVLKDPVQMKRVKNWGNCSPTVKSGPPSAVHAGCPTGELEEAQQTALNNFLSSHGLGALTCASKTDLEKAFEAEQAYQQDMCTLNKEMNDQQDKHDNAEKGTDVIGDLVSICYQTNREFAEGHAEKCNELLKIPLGEAGEKQQQYDAVKKERNQLIKDIDDYLRKIQADFGDLGKHSIGTGYEQNGTQHCYEIRIPGRRPNKEGTLTIRYDKLVYCEPFNPPTPDPKKSTYWDDNGNQQQGTYGGPLVDFCRGVTSQSTPICNRQEVLDEIRKAYEGANGIIGKEKQLDEIGNELEKLDGDSLRIANMCPLPSVPPWVSHADILPGPPRANNDRGIHYVLQLLLPSIANVLLVFMWGGVVLVIILAGILLLFSGTPAREGLVQTSKNMIYWAILGSIIATMGYTIVKFVIGINFLQ
ncbi:hypothetical protein H6771_00770 [Candidatus Peribacteria bacterium]|nr:hypothetical protein [Candidatus Peribacteria bacterium]